MNRAITHQSNKALDAKYQSAIAALKAGEDAEAVIEEHFDDLYEYYLNNGEMPYGVAKARDGDPYSWVSDRIQQDAGV